MNKYYHCIVRYLRMFFDKKGNQKYKPMKDQYLVYATNITEAQAILKENIDGIYTPPDVQQVEVVSVRQSKIICIFQKTVNLLGE